MIAARVERCARMIVVGLALISLMKIADAESWGIAMAMVALGIGYPENIFGTEKK